MRGKRAKQLRKVCRFMSEAWTEYRAVSQRDGRGRPVKPIVIPGKGDLPCIVRTGHEVRLDSACGKSLYRRMKINYKRAKQEGKV